MHKEVFQSLHESIRRRNTPEDFLPSMIDGKDVIHRGYLRNAAFPIRCDFIPDGRGHKNSGTIAYSFKDGDTTGVVEIKHQYSPNMAGHETSSRISYEQTNGENLDPIDIHRVLIPILNHHMQSINPDILEFEKSIKHSDDLIRRFATDYETSQRNSSNGSIRIAKRKIDPKTERIISNIRRRLNKNKEN